MSDRINSGTTPNGNKFHEIDTRLVQLNPAGVWVGYVNCKIMETFGSNESQALAWLKSTA